MEPWKQAGVPTPPAHSPENALARRGRTHSLSNLLPATQHRILKDRWRCNTVAYVALLAATALVLLVKGPLHQQAVSVVSGRMVIEETIRGGFRELGEQEGGPMQQQQQQQFGGEGLSGLRLHSSGSSGGGGGSSEGGFLELSADVGKSALFPASGMLGGGGVPAVGNATIWLYSLIPADYDGATVLPHWIKHYRGLGIHPANFIVLVNHNPEKYTGQGVKDVIDVLAEYGVRHRVWRGQYSSEAHLKQKLLLFNEIVGSMDDWILLADSDEFQDYGGWSIPEFLSHADKQGVTYVRGDLIDRLAEGGVIPSMQPEPSIYQQFPLQCHVVANLYHGKTKKVAAFKAFLRSNQGNHKIVPPEHASSYFAGSEPGQQSLRGGFYGSEDLFPLTPYYKHPDRYIYRGQPYSARSDWDDVPSPLTITVLHFKWHAAVLRNMEDRAKFYKGDADEGGLPRYRHYGEAERVVMALTGNNTLNLTGLHCASTLLLTQQRRAAMQQAQGEGGGAAGATGAGLPQVQLPLAGAVAAAAETSAGTAGTAGKPLSASQMPLGAADAVAAAAAEGGDSGERAGGAGDPSLHTAVQ